MRTTALFVTGVGIFVGGMIAGTAVPALTAQRTNPGFRLNHVQITVPNLEEALAFYTKVMGFRVAYELPNRDGRAATVFVQINRDTFLEVASAEAGAMPGITHIGLWTDDADAAVAQIRGAGAAVGDVRPTNSTGSRLATLIDRHGIRLEINEQPPESWMRKAMDSWR